MSGLRNGTERLRPRKKMRFFVCNSKYRIATFFKIVVKNSQFLESVYTAIEPGIFCIENKSSYRLKMLYRKTNWENNSISAPTPNPVKIPFAPPLQISYFPPLKPPSMKPLSHPGIHSRHTPPLPPISSSPATATFTPTHPPNQKSSKKFTPATNSF